MMKHLSRILLITFVFAFSVADSHADSWRDKTELLIYSPRYFGPNAFPIPEMRDGQVSERYEVEVRGEYHYYTGDKTWDIVGRALLPFFRGRAGIEVNWCFKEKYKMTPETRDERFAVETESPIKYNGDIVISSFFQVLKSEKWVDATISANIKTASGGRLCDARFTDAASYWLDVNVGRNLWKSADGKVLIRMQGARRVLLLDDERHGASPERRHLLRGRGHRQIQGVHARHQPGRVLRIREQRRPPHTLAKQPQIRDQEKHNLLPVHTRDEG